MLDRKLRSRGVFRVLGLLAAGLCAALALGFGVAPDATAAKKDSDKQKGEKLTLERIFPKRSFFGPTARSATFSHDGRFLAYLYRPYDERRHGADLYILDTKSGQTRRITSVGRMSEFQADARKVRDDREAKAKKAGYFLGRLAREQFKALGWTDGIMVDRWAGTAAAGAGVPLSGEVLLTLTEGAAGKFEGTLRIGFTQLTLTSVELDEVAGTGKAKIDDTTLKVKGDVALRLDGGSLRAEVKLSEPAQTLSLVLTRAPAEEEKAAEKDGETKTEEKSDGKEKGAEGKAGEGKSDESKTNEDKSGEGKADEKKPDAAKAAKGPAPRGVIDAIGERLTLGDVVLADDADINEDKDGKPVKDRAPRYEGVASIEWSTKTNEMLVQAGGDIYLLALDVAKWEAPVERPARKSGQESAEGETSPHPDEAVFNPDFSVPPDGAGEEGAGKSDEKSAKKKAPELKPVVPYRGELTRLTRTRERESDVQYLPDGSGYTYLRGGALLRVRFGEHQIVQLDPELKDGERMVGYRLSPDMKRLVFLATRGQSADERAATVTIVSYRDRFARAQEVRRHMPDDPWPEAYSSVYLYDLKGHPSEEGKLERVFTRRVTGPRDVMGVPEWSPDSSRIAFAAFDQEFGHMKILEAGFKVEEETKAKVKDGSSGDGKKDARKKDDTKKDDAEKVKDGEKKDVEKKDEDKKDGEKKDDGKKDEKDGEKRDGEKLVVKKDGDKDLKQDGVKKGEGKKDDAGEKKEEEGPAFKIENARVVYEFLHAGGPTTPGMVQPLYLPDSRRMVFITELSGYRQLHLLDPRYEQLTQVTSGQFELYPFHLTRDNKALYATSTEGDPNQEQVYRIDLGTLAISRLTQDPGVYTDVAVREDGTLVAGIRTDFGSPAELELVTPAKDGAKPAVRRLTESHPQEALKLTKAAPEYFTYENRHGQVIHGHMFKPSDWTAKDKRPLLIYVYGGPLGERKMATRGSFAAPSYFFARYMAENHGWVCATIDPRGASGYGAVFEKANFEQVGKPQTEDLVDGARWLVKNEGVDEKKMALHGWSFGGFQTQMVMYTEPDVFAVGMAGAGPTEWHNYNSWYSTGTIGANQPGKTDLEKYSLLPLAKNLKGKLLLIHGVEDSNVLYQDTMRVYRELLKADKEVNVELFIDPTGGHGLDGDVKTIGRYRKYEDFLIRNLGEGTAAGGGASRE